MESDGLYMIPFLSKELDLIGYSKLPYRINSKKKKKKKSPRHVKFRDEADNDDFSDGSVEECDSRDVEVLFDSKQMIGSLVSTCFKLVNEVKKMHMCVDPCTDPLDQMRFENNKLKRNLSSLKREIEEKSNLIAKGTEERRQLKMKLSELEAKTKHLEKEKMRITLQSESNNDIMKHKNLKIQKELDSLHDLLWKKSRMINTSNFPQNFTFLQPKEPNFNKLWSEVKYSSKNDKEEALKKAICLLQDNNEILLTENTVLKTLLFSSVEEINSAVEYLSQKINVPFKKSKSYLQKLFLIEEGLNAEEYRNHLRELLNIFTKMYD